VANAKLTNKIATAKNLTNEDYPNYDNYDPETAILLTKADSEIDYNLTKMLHYTDLLSAFNQKNWPEEAVKVKARVKRYTKLVDDLRKGRARLLESSKPTKGKQKAADFDPNPLISSDEEDEAASIGSVDPRALLSTDDEGGEDDVAGTHTDRGVTTLSAEDDSVEPESDEVSER